MASFVQTAPIQFAPYTPQYNTQLYAQIGMNRQAAYDTNVQKIQSYVDSVAGINVSRDVDKQYLQGKLGELQNNLNTLQNGDFSKNEVLNTAAGYVKYIANDKNILNAAISTANIQKDYEAMRKAQEEGKSARANDDLVQDRISGYMNSTELGATYQAQGYTPYYNIGEAFSKYYKDKQGNIQIEETPMGLNEDGTPNWRAYTLVNGKREYLTAAEVSRDFQSFLATDQQAAQQLEIDARYYAKNTSNEASLSLLNETYNRSLQTIDKEIESTEVLLNNSTGSERTKYEDKLEALRASRNSSVANHQESVRLFEENPEAFKRSAYMQSVMAGVGNRYAYESVETTLKKNPIAEMELQRQKFQADENERAFRRDLDTNKYNLDVARLKQSATKKASIDENGNVTYTEVLPTTVQNEPMSLEQIQAQQDVLQDEFFSGPGGMGEVLYYSQGNKDGAIIKTADGRYIPNPEDPLGWQKPWSALFDKWLKDPNSTPYMERFQRGRYTEGSPRNKMDRWRMNKKIIDNSLKEFNASLTPEQKEAQDLVTSLRGEINKVGNPRARELYSEYLDLVLNHNGKVPQSEVKKLNAKYSDVQLNIDAQSFLEQASERLYPTTFGGGSGTLTGVPIVGTVNLPRWFQQGQNSLYRIANQYNESGILQPKKDLAAKLAVTNQDVAISYTTKETEQMLPSIMNIANSRKTGGKDPKVLESMEDVINANGRTNVASILRRNPNTGAVTLHLVGLGKKGSSMSEGLELSADQAEVFAPGITMPVENDTELQAIQLSDKQTTEGLLNPYVPKINVNKRYSFQTHFGKMGNDYYPKIMYFDRQDQSKGWRQLPILADMYFQDMNGQRGSGLTRAKSFVDAIYRLDAETFENTWFKDNQ